MGKFEMGISNLENLELARIAKNQMEFCILNDDISNASDLSTF